MASLRPMCFAMALAFVAGVGLAQVPMPVVIPPRTEPLFETYLALARPSFAIRLGLSEKQLASVREAVDQFQTTSWRPYILMPTGSQDTEGLQVRRKLGSEAGQIYRTAQASIASALSVQQRQDLFRLEKEGLPAEDFTPVGEEQFEIKIELVGRDIVAPKGHGREYRLNERGVLTDAGTGGLEGKRSVRVAAEIDAQGRRIDVLTEDKHGEFRVWHPEHTNITAVAFSPDGKSLAVGCGRFAGERSNLGGELRIWNTADGALQVRKSYDSPVAKLLFADDRTVWVAFRRMELK